jgi:photosystem II stability/assembly factor-like uncharacterized protein
MIAPDPDDPDIVYGGRVDKLDTRTEQVRSIDPTLAYPAVHYRAAWTLPLAFSKRNTKVLYFANQRLFQTDDGGDHWKPISPDLTRPDAGVPANLDAPTAADDDHVDKRRGVIYTIAPSPLSAQTLWVGTDDGLVWRTDDEGAHWDNVTSAALTPWSKVGGIEPSHFSPDMAYLAIDRHRLDDDAPYIYRTTDGGKSWTRIDRGIPSDCFVNVVREDPVRKGLLYAGTEKGMYVSFDGGANWQSLQQNLPLTSVRDIDVHQDDLVIATHGRGFWIMDDMTALRQMDGVSAAQVTLFKPAYAIRVRHAAFTGTPMPKDEPMAANPPDGAMIDYVLPEHVKGPVTLTILDAQNNQVRSFSSDDKPPMLDPAKLEFAPEWVPIPTPLFTTPGMHRFVWNLRYASQGETGKHSKDGVWAPPGSYTIELSVNGHSYRQPLIVKPDPRVTVSVLAMQREFELARKVENESAQASKAGAEAEALLQALDQRQAHANGALHDQIGALIAQTTDLSGMPLHPDPRDTVGAPPRRTDSLRALSTNLSKLLSAVDDADADPSPDARTAYATLSQTLTATLGDWAHMKQHDLSALNDKLKAAGEKPIAL